MRENRYSRAGTCEIYENRYRRSNFAAPSHRNRANGSNLVKELARIDKTNEYFLYSKLDFELPFEDPRWHKRILQRRDFQPLSRYYLTGIGKTIATDLIDVFWEANQILPFWLPAHLRKVVSVYDFVWHLFPETVELRNRVTHRLLAERSLRNADRLVCDWECSSAGLDNDV